jgi:hypothetical protein
MYQATASNGDGEQGQQRTLGEPVDKQRAGHRRGDGHGGDAPAEPEVDQPGPKEPGERAGEAEDLAEMPIWMACNGASSTPDSQGKRTA